MPTLLMFSQCQFVGVGMIITLGTKWQPAAILLILHLTFVPKHFFIPILFSFLKIKVLVDMWAFLCHELASLITPLVDKNLWKMEYAPLPLAFFLGEAPYFCWPQFASNGTGTTLCQQQNLFVLIYSLHEILKKILLYIYKKKMPIHNRNRKNWLQQIFSKQ